MVDTKSQFLFKVKLSPNKGRNTDGSLTCTNAVICRTGEMEYGPGEITMAGGGKNDKRIRVMREEDEVFKPVTIASFNGRAVTDGHPPEFIETDSPHRIGTVMNPRRGEGAENQLLLADLVIWKESLILKIESGEVSELSCGYDAGLETIGVEGETILAKQVDIIGNHVAIVPETESGRAGQTVRIRDSKGKTMADDPKTPNGNDTVSVGALTKILTLVGLAGRFNDTDTDDKKDYKSMYEDMKSKYEDMKKEMEDMKKSKVQDSEDEEDGDKKDRKEGKHQDSVPQSIIDAAEVIAPGLTPSSTIQADALRAAFADSNKKDVLVKNGLKEFKEDSVEMDFVRAHDILAEFNDSQTQDIFKVDVKAIYEGQAKDPAEEMNKQAEEAWKDA